MADEVQCCWEKKGCAQCLVSHLVLSKLAVLAKNTEDISTLSYIISIFKAIQ